MGGKTLVIMKIRPSNQRKIGKTEADVKAIKSGDVKDIKREQIGFGIEIIKAGILIKEKDEDAVEALLKEVNELDSVDDAEIEGMTLL